MCLGAELLGHMGIPCLTLWGTACLFLYEPPFSIPSCSGTNQMIPAENIEDLVEHVVLVHESVGEFSKQFLQKLRRCNYVTPKNYLDFINTYSKLLDEKTQYNIGKTWEGDGTIRRDCYSLQVRIPVLMFSLSRCFLSKIDDTWDWGKAEKHILDFAPQKDVCGWAKPWHAFIFVFLCWAMHSKL